MYTVFKEIIIDEFFQTFYFEEIVICCWMDFTYIDIFVYLLLLFFLWFMLI